ncbi:MAG: hypothetical protein ACYC2H_04700 [Thermoplasmatota archaeon]
MRLGAALTLLILLAGCSDAPEESTGSIPESATTTSSAPVVVAQPVVDTILISFDGNLGTSVHGCVFPAGVCDTREVVADETDVIIERPGANLTAVSFDITWEATSPATQTLDVGVMVMASCDGCNDTEFVSLKGPSPLHVEASGLSLALTQDAVLHIYVYNSQGLVHNPAVPAYALASVDQAFHIEGTATFLVPPV